MNEFNSENFWNEEYWTKYLEKNKEKKELDFTKDDWIENYCEIFNNIPKGKALDLGSGLGQDTKFLLNKGFDVLSADISEKALKELIRNVPTAKIIKLDMSKKLPFDNEQFNLVFANLSTHYYNWNDTTNLYNEIKRILKKGGYFIGRVNSDKTMKNDVEIPIKIEDNYYFDKRYLRYFTKEQFDLLFRNWNVMILNETVTKRWEREKTLWEFIVKKD